MLTPAEVTASRGEPLTRRPPSTAERGPLTEREAEILTLIVQGLSNDEISSTLSISRNTVKSHIRQAYRRIGARTRAQAVAWADQQGPA